MPGPLKLKIVRKTKTHEGAGLLRRARTASASPYTLRVHRDHGGGLWTFEDATGQLYLAVKSREFRPAGQDGRDHLYAEAREAIGRGIDRSLDEYLNSEGIRQGT